MKSQLTNLKADWSKQSFEMNQSRKPFKVSDWFTVHPKNAKAFLKIFRFSETFKFNRNTLKSPKFCFSYLEGSETKK